MGVYCKSGRLSSDFLFILLSILYTIQGMFLLLMFYQLHSLFYNGDILLLYAVMGLFIVSVSHLFTKAILIIASVMTLQPIE